MCPRERALMRVQLSSAPGLLAESRTRTGVRTRTWLGPLAGVGLLIATVYYVDAAALWLRVSQLRFGFIALGAALVVPQLQCLALRWRQTAARLGYPLGARRALREYALSMLLNQLLPFGVAGDAVRTVRHATAFTDRDAADAPHTVGLSSALHGVMLERFLGQVVVVIWAVVTLPLWFGAVGSVLAVAALALMVLIAYMLRRLPAPADLSAHGAVLRALLRLSLALQRLLASPRYLASQFLLSSAVTLGLVAQLYCALWALGLSLSAAQALQVFPLMLLSMSVPLSFAGFGPREAVTAELYAILHLSAADGAAFAMAFGAMMVVSSLPCLALVLLLSDTTSEPMP
jgi:glycosyltransferase 2 family protein